MPSLTPLHESYCRWDRTPPSQADVLEGLAQLVSSNLLGLDELLACLQQDLLQQSSKLSDQITVQLQQTPHVDKLYQLFYHMAQKSGHHLLAPGLRRIIDKFPKLQAKPLNPSLHFLVGVLNGILGDYLLAHHNPLALPMLLYDHYGALQRGELAGRVVIFVHGLGMNHLHWSTRKYAGIGERLLAQRDHNTMLYLNYNSGRRISANGRSLAVLLQQLIQQHPQIDSIDLIGHSMGGLVARSALFYGKQNLHDWMHRVNNLVCIGTPNHGASLERFSHTLQEKLHHWPVIKILGHAINIRSNGILDLRYGSVRDDDWEHLPARIGLMDDNRKPAPLPSYINSYMIAGTVESENNQNKALNILGDYLVSVKSALGEHPHPRFQLKLPESHKAVFYGLNHFEIQYHPVVAEQIARWFYADNQEESTEQPMHEYLVQVEQRNWENLRGIVET